MESIFISGYSGRFPDCNNIQSSIKSRFITNGIHLITGGMGGFGMELAEWLLQCGANQVLLFGRTPISNLYQSQKFQKYKNKLIFIQGDVTNEKDISSIFITYNIMGIWHLAMKLEDKLYENMSNDSWENVINVKYLGAKLLNKYCKENTLFVCWSSISSLFGNPGQTNYSHGNYLMEQLCRERRNNKKHGLSICWGPIDNIGYLIQENSKINKLMFLPQNINDCLNDLHRLLQTNNSVISCYKLNPLFGKKEDSCNTDSLLKMVISIIGLNMNDIINLDKNITLQELGMDSLQSASIKNIIKSHGKEIKNIFNIKLSDLV